MGLWCNGSTTGSRWSFDAFMAYDLERNQLIWVRLPATPIFINK